MGHGTRRRGFAIALSLTALVLLAPAPGASAELTEHGDLFVRFHGGIEPTALPRHELAPISVGVGGAIKTLPAARLSAILNHYGYITMIALRLHRTYRFRGQARSYLSAACVAPAGFPGASFPFARASMSFADGRRLSSTLIRSCRVSD